MKCGFPAVSGYLKNVNLHFSGFQEPEKCKFTFFRLPGYLKNVNLHFPGYLKNVNLQFSGNLKNVNLHFSGKIVNLFENCKFTFSGNLKIVLYNFHPPLVGGHVISCGNQTISNMDVEELAHISLRSCSYWQTGWFSCHVWFPDSIKKNVCNYCSIVLYAIVWCCMLASLILMLGLWMFEALSFVKGHLVLSAQLRAEGPMTEKPNTSDWWMKWFDFNWPTLFSFEKICLKQKLMFQYVFWTTLVFVGDRCQCCSKEKFAVWPHWPRAAWLLAAWPLAAKKPNRLSGPVYQWNGNEWDVGKWFFCMFLYVFVRIRWKMIGRWNCRVGTTW